MSKFEKIIKEKTDSELTDIFINSSDYQEEFITEVQEELTNRNIQIDALIKLRNEESVSIVVSNLEKPIKDAKKEGANKDMLHGALWCIGGVVATASDLGFIFWGAIVFGAVQFFKGVANS